jgi:hypothetical protein
VVKMGSAPTDPDARPEREAFVARLAEEDGVETCTIAPLPRSERMLLAEWVRAREGSFVALDEMR